jgi:hypothetical protein
MKQMTKIVFNGDSSFKMDSLEKQGQLRTKQMLGLNGKI